MFTVPLNRYLYQNISSKWTWTIIYFVRNTRDKLKIISTYYLTAFSATRGDEVKSTCNYYKHVSHLLKGRFTKCVTMIRGFIWHTVNMWITSSLWLFLKLVVLTCSHFHETGFSVMSLWFFGQRPICCGYSEHRAGRPTIKHWEVCAKTAWKKAVKKITKPFKLILPVRRLCGWRNVMTSELDALKKCNGNWIIPPTALMHKLTQVKKHTHLASFVSILVSSIVWNQVSSHIVFTTHSKTWLRNGPDCCTCKIRSSGEDNREAGRLLHLANTPQIFHKCLLGWLQTEKGTLLKTKVKFSSFKPSVWETLSSPLACLGL